MSQENKPDRGPTHRDLKQMFDSVGMWYMVAVFTMRRIDDCKDFTAQEPEHFELLSPKEALSTEAVLAELKTKNLRPALFQELVAFVADKTGEQLSYPIVALGSVFEEEGVLVSPMVYGLLKQRHLSSTPVKDGLETRHRLLVVRLPA